MLFHNVGNVIVCLLAATFRRTDNQKPVVEISDSLASAEPCIRLKVWVAVPLASAVEVGAGNIVRAVSGAER